MEEKTMISTKPILFNTEMVKALLDGRKSVTRRVVKPQPKMQLSYICSGCGCGRWNYPPENCVEQGGWDEKYRRIDGLTAEDNAMFWTPPFHANDILYVRETWAELGACYTPECGYELHYIYRASFEPNFIYDIPHIKWRPSIHMPKEAARIFLRVTAVRVERLHDITEEQAKAEGAIKGNYFVDSDGETFFEIRPNDGYYRCGFRHLWNLTIKKSDLPVYGWEANPWVWVIEFERFSKEEAKRRSK